MPRLSGTCNVGTVKYSFYNDSELLPASPHARALTPAPLSQDSVGDGEGEGNRMGKFCPQHRGFVVTCGIMGAACGLTRAAVYLQLTAATTFTFFPVFDLQ